MPKAFVPTTEQRRQVEMMVGFGLTHDQICQLFHNPDTDAPIDRKTLYQHCRRELDRGFAAITARVAESLLQIALNGVDERNRLAACSFWLARRAGWKEASQVEITGEAGAAIEVADIRARISAKIARIHQGMDVEEDDLTSRPYLANGGAKH